MAILDRYTRNCCCSWEAAEKGGGRRRARIGAGSKKEVQWGEDRLE
jgi:hypothetical protein